MTAGASAVAPLPLARVAGYLLGIAGLAFCIALLWLGMRAVMDLGGFCASGGPYEIAVECPDAVIATTPLSILGGFLAAGLIIWGAAGLPGAWMSLVFLAWPALVPLARLELPRVRLLPARGWLGLELAVLRRAVRPDGSRAARRSGSPPSGRRAAVAAPTRRAGWWSGRGRARPRSCRHRS